MVLIKIVNRDVRHIGRVNTFASELIPVETFEPGMLLQLVCPIDKADSVLGLSLQTPVDEICGFYRPPFRDFITLDLNLAAEYLFPNFPSIATYIWSPAHHAFISDDSHCKVICCKSMVLPAHDFWRHVAGSARSLARVVRCHDSCDTKVSEPQVALIIKNHILRLDVSMNNICCVNCFQGVHKTRNKKPCHLLRKFPFPSDVVPEVAS